MLLQPRGAIGVTGWARPADAGGAWWGDALPEVPRVVLRGLGWKMVAGYLQELGGRVVDTAEPSQAPVRARLAGDGWQATLQEQVEFVGALRVNRVEVRLSGEATAIEEVLGALRRMALPEARLRTSRGVSGPEGGLPAAPGSPGPLTPPST